MKLILTIAFVITLLAMPTINAMEVIKAQDWSYSANLSDNGAYVASTPDINSDEYLFSYFCQQSSIDKDWLRREMVLFVTNRNYDSAIAGDLFHLKMQIDGDKVYNTEFMLIRYITQNLC